MSSIGRTDIVRLQLMDKKDQLGQKEENKGSLMESVITFDQYNGLQQLGAITLHYLYAGQRWWISSFIFICDLMMVAEPKVPHGLMSNEALPW